MINTDDEEKAFLNNVDEMLDQLITLSAEKWASSTYDKRHLEYHIRRLCEMYASRAVMKAMIELKNQTDEQKAEQEKETGKPPF
jgi:hypothetical protein